MPNQKRLVDAVHMDRPSPLADQIDQLRDALAFADIDTNAMLDVISMRWMLADVLRGQGYSIGQVISFDGDPWQRVEVSNE